jgi:hypothetical protein
MDCDDWSYPERLEVQLRYLDANPDVVLAGSLSEIIEIDGKTSFQYRSPSQEQLYHDLTFDNVFPHSSVIFKKQIALEIHCYDESLKRAQDFDLWYRISRRWPIAMIDKKLIRWRNSPENISNKYSERQMESAGKIYERNLKQLFLDKDDLKDFFCFHKNSGRIKFKELLMLKEINRRLVENCPPHIDKKKLKKFGNKRLMLYFLKSLLGLKFVKYLKEKIKLSKKIHESK